MVLPKRSKSPVRAKLRRAAEELDTPPSPRSRRSRQRNGGCGFGVCNDAAFAELLERAATAPYSFAAVPSCDADLSDSVVLRIVQRQQLTLHIDELLHLCTEASRRTMLRQRPRDASLKWTGSPPLRVEYMADRLDIDDPLHGYLVRHRTGGWLQGFLCVTTFTHWQLWFRWDSTAPEAGLTTADRCDPPHLIDDGSLARELAAMDHAGDPTKHGVIWPRIAEISLLGALGCGSWLVRLVLEELEAGNDYDYVVLSATDSSIGFYARLGFVRVGALARYVQPSGVLLGPLVGFRHWTFSDEPMAEMPEPSKMMARRLIHRKPQRHRAEGSMATALAKLLVKRPPRVCNGAVAMGQTHAQIGLETVSSRSDIPRSVVMVGYVLWLLGCIGFAVEFSALWAVILGLTLLAIALSQPVTMAHAEEPISRLLPWHEPGLWSFHEDFHLALAAADAAWLALVLCCREMD